MKAIKFDHKGKSEEKKHVMGRLKVHILYISVLWIKPLNL